MVSASLKLHNDSLHFSSAQTQIMNVHPYALTQDLSRVCGTPALAWGEPSGDSDIMHQGHRPRLVLPCPATDFTGILLFPHH